MEAFYLGEYPHRLFAVLHLPERATKTGLVFCPPFGEEMPCTYARLARWAKELTDRGYAVLRYHPYGTGDSDGSSSALTLDSALADAAVAVRCLQERADIEHVGIFGLRFGGSVAVQAAKLVQPDFLLLWSPIINLQRYLNDLLRLRLTAELVRQQSDRPRLTTQAMIQELQEGRSIDILGHELTPELYRQMTASAAWPDEPPARDVLWLARPIEKDQGVPIIEAWKSHGGAVDVELLPEPAFWQDFGLEFPHKFAATSWRWLERGAPSKVSVQ